MKKIILFAGLVLLVFKKDYAQTVQASIGIGSNSNAMRIYLRPSITATPAVFSTLQFNVAIPADVTPVPALQFVSQAFTGVTWIIDPPYLEDNMWNYNIYNAAAGYTLNVTAGVEFVALELAFIGGPLVSTPNTAHITCLADGGTVTGNAYFFCSGTLSSSGQNLFYVRPLVTIFNGDSYFGVITPGSPTGTAGTQTSFARYDGGIVLPIKWLSFTAVKQGNDGHLNWAVTDENDNHHYELQRSDNGTDFTSIATINRSANGGGVYNYTDVGIASFSNSIFYYRVKQVELNGNFSYSDIKHISIDKKGTAITIFPNPVSKGFYINVPQTGTATEKVKLNLFATNGQIVASKEITAQQAANYYFDITDKKLAAGQYSLQVIINEKTVASKMLTIKQ